MKVLVTGGAGFIGSHIVDFFQDKAEVVVFDNLSTGSKGNIEGMNYDFIQGDILDSAALLSAAKGCDYIFHLAAFVSVPESINQPERCNAVNVEGTRNVLEAAKTNGVRGVVFSSSCAVYGDTQNLPISESSKCEPKTPYATSKLEAEKLCADYEAKFGFRTCCFRFFNVFGPRQAPESEYAAVVPIFIRKALDDKRITVFGDGGQTRDFIYVKDIVRAFDFAKDSLSGVFNLGTGKETSILGLAEKIIEMSESESKISFEPSREGDINRSYGDISKLLSAGFSLKYEFEEGLKETVSWTRKWISS